MLLCNAIKNFQSQPNPQNEMVLINELKKAEFLAPIIIAAPLAKSDGSAFYEEEGSNIKFALLEDEQNSERFFPAFTSRDEMMKWRNDIEQEVINLRLKDYANILLNEASNYQGIVIDAYSSALILNLAFFRALFQD